MGVLLIHEPTAGDAPWPAKRLLALLAAAGLDAEHRSTADPDFAEVLARTRQLTIAAGGDGTVARVATGLPDRSVPLLILPMGSANNLSRSLGVFGEIEDLIAGIAGAATTPLGIGEARGRWGVRRFVEAVGLGAIARVTAALQDARLQGDSKREIGRRTLRETVEALEPIRAVIYVDDALFSAPCLLFEIMNIAMIGPNLPLGPAERPNDGALAVVWLPVDARESFLAWLQAPDGPSPMRSVRARLVTVEAPDEALRIDDKTVEWDGSRIDFRLEPEPVNVLVPRRLG